MKSDLLRIVFFSLCFQSVGLFGLLLSGWGDDGTPKARAQERSSNGDAPLPSSPWNFRNHVLSVLSKSGCNSGACHGAASGKNGFKLSLRGYDPEGDYEVLTRQSGGRRICKLEPAQSLILLKPTLAIASHGGGKRLEVGSREYRVISEWIASGAPGPSEKDPRLVKLEVLPPQAILAPGQKEPLKVVAYFSDGDREDVTRWAKYSSTDEGVVTVDEEGRVHLRGSGEAAVTVWYLSQVTFATFSAPYPNTIAETELQQAARYNYIDDLVRQKLSALRISPSKLSIDSEFIRRAYLDATGVLPTPGEVREFLAHASPKKRQALIDHLLARPEFIDYWTYKWSELLLVNRTTLTPGGMWRFRNWIHESVAANKPWDQFVREILLATGSSLETGPANYFRIHRTPQELSESTLQAFLGVRIACARCHNHPFEKWTQKDYYGFANLFSRVVLKEGFVPGDLTVTSAPQGEINHPKVGEPMAPRALDAEPMPLSSREDRRAYLAKWLTSQENPWFARSLVNRVWRELMGRGLIEPVDDLRATNPASNEALLRSLTQDFVSHGFDVKYLIRVIMNSAAYQRSSNPVEGNRQDDRFYSRYLIKRLPAEVLLDAMAQATGATAKFESFPQGTRALELPDSEVKSTFLDVFGRPKRKTTCACERQEEPSITQALHLLNNEALNARISAPGGMVDAVLKVGMGNEPIVEHFYLASLSRFPLPSEKTRLVSILDKASDSERAHRQALEDFLWAVTTSKEFLFNH